jgi:hypothetical protein
VPWFEDAGILKTGDEKDFELSYKLKFLVEIMKKCEEVGDKVNTFWTTPDILTFRSSFFPKVA